MDEYELIKASSRSDWSEARRLVVEYADSLEFDLGFQDFSLELDSLEDQYGPPSGAFVLARISESAAGCVALRKFDSESCEMKRLFVRAEARGTGLGRQLVESIIEEGRLLRYSRMILDTVPSMIAARRLYSRFGFMEIEPYRFNPVEGTSFMELRL